MSLPVFFYDEDDKNVEEILEELETVDDNLESQAVEFVRCSDAEALDEYGLQAWLPDSYSLIFRSYVFGHSGMKDYGFTTLRCKI